MRAQGMKSSEVLHDDQTYDEKKIFTWSTTPPALGKVFVTRVLTRAICLW